MDNKNKTPQAGLGAAPAEVSQAEESNHTLEDWPMIHSYTRAEAIDDGVLVDCGAFMWGPARIVDVVGFLYPVAMTARAYGAITDGCDMGTVQNKVALAACLRSLHSAIKASPPDGGGDVHFQHEPLMVPGLFVKMWARCGPGDDAEPVVTIMLEGED
jgi:hypothetical protein